MNDKKLFVIDAKSLLQTNATILAGALIFLTLSEQLTSLAIILFLIGIYSIVASIILCLKTAPKNPVWTKTKEWFWCNWCNSLICCNNCFHGGNPKLCSFLKFMTIMRKFTLKLTSLIKQIVMIGCYPMRKS